MNSLDESPAPDGGEPGAFNPLVKIQEGRTIPFFCVHGAGGNVLNFRELARLLGEQQTFYGLQAKGVDGGPTLDTVEEMAELYLSQVVRVHPKGPYLLGGYSAGGIVAYDMAQRLVARGCEVKVLALLDTFRPGVKPAQTTLKYHLSQLVREGPNYLPRRAKARLSRHVNEVSNELKVRFYMSQGQPLPFELRELQMTRSFLEAADQYVPRPYGGPVVLYRAELTAPAFAHTGPTRGWGEFVQDLDVVVVPGDHDTIVYEPNVSVMTSHLAKLLRSVVGG